MKLRARTLCCCCLGVTANGFASNLVVESTLHNNLKKNDQVANLSTHEKSQKKNIVVKGLITDGDGAPLMGATVGVKGTTIGVITDIDGRYSIDAPKGATLEYRYIGFNNEERQVKSDAPINVRMMESSIGLEDVVVIGYGQQKKSSVVASINTISSKELSMPTRSLANNIAGQIAGVYELLGCFGRTGK